MTREMYCKMTQPFRDQPKRAKSLHRANQILTGIVFAAYPLLLIGLFFWQPKELFRAIVVPLDGFIGVSVFRCLVNRKRPYEAFGLPPVIPKKTAGKSFPSRHVFSAAIIAFTFCAIPHLMWIGIVLVVCTVLIAILRVIAGVHYISDVVAAVLIAAVIVLVASIC